MDPHIPASEWPEIPHDGASFAEAVQRLAWWQEKRRVEDLLRKREAGFDLAAHEEAAIAYSPFGTAAGGPARGFFLGSA